MKKITFTKNELAAVVWVSTLENGITIVGRREVGSYVWTQWGKRKVISCKLVEYDDAPDMPDGC